MKIIVSIKDFAKAVKEELSRFHKLSYQTLASPWTVSSTPEGYNTVHEEDPMTHLKRVGRVKSQKLADVVITKVKYINISTLEQQTR